MDGRPDQGVGRRETEGRESVGNEGVFVVQDTGDPEP